MKRPYAAFTGSGGGPADRDIDPDIYNVFGQRHIRNKIGNIFKYLPSPKKIYSNIYHFYISTNTMQKLKQ